ncbi:MAG TPA: BamA/TamA family outer membrane protein [Polyangiaceae bacterium]
MNRWLGLFFGFFLVARAGIARAEDRSYSALEQSVTEQELRARKWELEPAPEGKRIEDIQIATIDVFDERDPVPDFVDIFHTTTRKAVVRRELLFEKGAFYDQRLADESARNLRELIQLSIVLVVTAKGSTPDRVRVLVITKDVWSLRLNWGLQSSNAQINSLVLNPSEENLLGQHILVAGIFVLDPATYSLGFDVGHRRFFGSHVIADFEANFIKNRDTGESEGSYGDIRWGQPLYSIDTEWSWGAAVLWRHNVQRRFLGIDVATYNAVATPQDDRIPIEYKQDLIYGGYELVRSFGHHYKNDVSIGFEAVRAAYQVPNLAGFEPRAVAEFTRVQVPVSDQRLSPFVQLHAHETDFRSLLNVETLALQEDFPRGHDLLLRLYSASESLGSTRTLLGSISALSYTLPIGDGFVRPSASAQLQYASRGRDDAQFIGDFRFVSPRLGFGRLILDEHYLNHFRNYLNNRYVLGGENRLRGYPVGAFIGANVFAASAELRTSSVDILSAQVGAATFYDVGDANDDARKFVLKQDAGVGLRILFPEFDRVIFRADWGFPLSTGLGYQPLPGAFFVSFEQAFAMPGITPPSLLTTTL